MRLRRFTLVAFAVTGAVMWATMLIDRHPLVAAYPFIGLVAAMIAASIGWQPRALASWPAKVLLCGCISFAVIGFALPAAHEIHVDLDSFGAWLGLVWLVAVGVLAELTIAGCRPWHVYLGTLVAFSSVIPTVTLYPFDIFVAVMGVTLCTLPALLAAAVTSAIIDHRIRRRALDNPPLPQARTAPSR
jgi:hypothetical protein